MIDEARFAQFEHDVRYLKDRLAILDVVQTHARGHDRFDSELLTDAYHPDGIDEHGAAVNAGPVYAEWANAVHEHGALVHLHNITTHNCEIDGDTAHAESYVLVGLLNHDGESVRFINGRYVDRLEKRDGAWKIALRRCTLDFLISGDASLLKSPYIKAGGYITPKRDRSDVSYQRPLSRDAEAERL